VTCLDKGHIMNRVITILSFAAMLALSACADTGTYPVGGDQCGPTDPVKDLEAADCTVPGTP
jgi:hypothetical protein